MDETDPVAGNRKPWHMTIPAEAFTVRRQSCPRPTHGLEVFATVRGGGYFFMPGLLVVKHLAGVPGVALDPIVVNPPPLLAKEDPPPNEAEEIRLLTKTLVDKVNSDYKPGEKLVRRDAYCRSTTAW